MAKKKGGDIKTVERATQKEAKRKVGSRRGESSIPGHVDPESLGNPTKRTIVLDKRRYLSRVLTSLVQTGWILDAIPNDAAIPRNGMLLILRLAMQEIRIRVFVYKVTTSGRNRSHERRIEITTTYQSGLKQENGFEDIVLGYDPATETYVGIDGRRLHMGGRTHNASSFFDLEGLTVPAGQIRAIPRRVTSAHFPTGVEYHTFLHGDRLADYLFNHRALHSGAKIAQEPSTRSVARPSRSSAFLHRPYTVGEKAFELSLRTTVKSRKARPFNELVAAAEAGDLTKLKKPVSPEELALALQRCVEIGDLGEQVVLAFERKRLTKLGFIQEARLVERVSLRSVSEGYDIISYEDDGCTKRYLEVKSTTGTGAVVIMSLGEWKAAIREQEAYYIVRVTNTSADPKIHFVRNPALLEGSGAVIKTPSGWKLDLSKAIPPANRTR